MPPWVTPSISTVNRLCWLKSPAVFLVVPLRTSRLNFTGIHLLLCDPRGGRALRSGGGHSAPGFHFTLSGPLPDRRSCAPCIHLPSLGDTIEMVSPSHTCPVREHHRDGVPYRSCVPGAADEPAPG